MFIFDFYKRFAKLQADVFDLGDVTTASDHVMEWARTYKKKSETRAQEIASKASSTLFVVFLKG